jgi:hypothetical protein
MKGPLRDWPRSSVIAAVTRNMAKALHENVSGPSTMAPSNMAAFHSERGASQTIVPSTGEAVSRLVSELTL